MDRRKFVISLTSILISFWAVASSGGQPLSSLLPKERVQDWTLIEKPQTYTARTLFEHIDGQAELFFKYGYQKSIFGVYQDRQERESQIEVDIYDMGNVLHAFGIFSRFRTEDRPAGMGLDSYLDDQSAFFYKNKFFVVLYGTATDPPSLKQLGMAISSRLPGNSIPPREIGYFPRDGLKPGSVQYFPDGLLGHQFLKRGFQATYLTKDEDEVKVQVEGKDKNKVESRLFFAMFSNSGEARRGLRAYKDYLAKKGKVDPLAPARFGRDAVEGEDPYQGQVIIAQKGSSLLGAVGFQRLEDAENRLAEIMQEVR